MRLSIVIPAYNEEKRIGAVLKEFKDTGAELIVVADGSDRTAKIARSFDIKVLEFKNRLGKGGGVKMGMEVATGDVIGFIDSDNSVPKEDFMKLVSALESSDADVAIGSRRVRGAVIRRKQPFTRRLMSRLFNLYVNTLFNLKISDTQCGAKVLKRECVDTIIPKMVSRGFEFDVELLWRLKKSGYKVIEVPVSWGHEDGSTFTLKKGPRMCWSLLMLRIGFK